MEPVDRAYLPNRICQYPTATRQIMAVAIRRACLTCRLSIIYALIAEAWLSENQVFSFEQHDARQQARDADLK
jgi:hypothetical protein